MGKQSSLEKIGFERRAIELNRSDYNKNDMYSESHEDAKSHDDLNHPLGKGTGHSYTHSIPQEFNAATMNTIKPQLDTTNGGGSYDKYGRNGVGGRDFLMKISKYNVKNQYGIDSVDSSANIADGQFYTRIK